MKTIIIIMGFPGSGKSTMSAKLKNDGWFHINRDMFDKPGKVCSSVDFHTIHLDKVMEQGVQSIVVDNTYPSVAARKLVIDLAKKHGYEIQCVEMSTTIEETEFNVCRRMIQRYGKLVDKDENQATKNDSNIFPPAVLFQYQKKYEKPTIEEGFSIVTKAKYVRKLGSEYKNKAIFLDFDGTIRKTKSGNIYPVHPDDIELLPNIRETIHRWMMTHKIFGVSNQSGIHKGDLTMDAAFECFDRTNLLTSYQIQEYKFCPHGVPPVSCYCRKPMPGMGVYFIEKYQLDPSQCIMVGDMTSDKTFAKRCGFQYQDQAEFFKI